MNRNFFRTAIISIVSFTLGMVFVYFTRPRIKAHAFAATRSTSISWDEARTMMDLYNRDINGSSLKMESLDGRTTVLKGFRFDAGQIRSVLDRNPNGTPNELVICFGATESKTTMLSGIDNSPEIHIIALGSVQDDNNPFGRLLIPEDPRAWGRSFNSGIFDHADPCPPSPVALP